MNKDANKGRAEMGDTKSYCALSKMTDMQRIIVYMLLLISLLQSCDGGNNIIETVVDKYDDADFSELRGYCVWYRSSGNNRNTSILFVSKFDDSVPPYMVEYDTRNKEVVSISKRLLNLNGTKDYLSKDRIMFVAKKYSEYRLCVLEVDSFENVYMNPDRPEFPTLLRKNPNSVPNDFRRYKHYKRNWYVRK